MLSCDSWQETNFLSPRSATRWEEWTEAGGDRLNPVKWARVTLASTSNRGFRRLIAYEFWKECHMVMRADPSVRWHGTGIGEIVSLWTNRRLLNSLARQDLRRTYAGTVGG